MVEKREITITVSSSGILVTLGFLYGLLHGGLGAGVAGAVIGFALSLASTLGLVPFIGVPLYYLAVERLLGILGRCVSLAGSGVFDLLFWLSLFFTAVVNFVVSLAVLLYIRERI